MKEGPLFVEQLSKMRLLPKLYGQEISSVFKQKYHGHITIIPDLIWDEKFGTWCDEVIVEGVTGIIAVKAIMNPTVKDMIHYIAGGQRAVWPAIRKIDHLITIERWYDM